MDYLYYSLTLVEIVGCMKLFMDLMPFLVWLSFFPNCSFLHDLQLTDSFLHDLLLTNPFLHDLLLTNPFLHDLLLTNPLFILFSHFKTDTQPSIWFLQLFDPSSFTMNLPLEMNLLPLYFLSYFPSFPNYNGVSQIVWNIMWHVGIIQLVVRVALTLFHVIS